MDFIRRKPKHRPYAANSTGKLRGTLKTRIGQLLVFAAEGSARAKFADDISPAILQYLRDNSEELQVSTSYIGLSLWMMGKSAEKTKPVVMLVSNDKPARVEAYRLIRDSAIMANYPGFDLGEMELRAEFENFQPLGSEYTDDMWNYESWCPPAPAPEPSSMGSRHDKRSPASFTPPENPITVFGKLDRPFQAWRLEVETGEGSETRRSMASTGGGVSFQGEDMVQCVSHFLSSAPLNCHGWEGAVGSASLTSENDVECEIMDLSDFEDDDMAEITSRGSVSPEVSDEEAASGPSSPSGSEWSLRPDSPPSSESLDALSSPASAFDNRVDAPEGEASQPVAEAALSTTAGQVVLASSHLDSAFIRINSPTPTGFCIPLESYQEHVETAPTIDVAITTTTRRGLVTGTLSGTPFFVRLPGTKEFQEVYTARFDSPLQPGDCGCWVKGEISGKLFGHVIAGSTTSGLVLLMPATRVFAQLLEDLEARYAEAEVEATETARATLTQSVYDYVTAPPMPNLLGRYLEDAPLASIFSLPQAPCEFPTRRHTSSKGADSGYSSRSSAPSPPAAPETDFPHDDLDAPVRVRPSVKRRANWSIDDDRPSKKRRIGRPTRTALSLPHQSSGKLLPGRPATLYCREPSCVKAKHPFSDQISLDAHLKEKHTRPFKCVFHFAGCTSTFASKNEWKRHVASQHMLLNYWLCEAGECGRSCSGAASPLHRSRSKATESLPPSEDSDTEGARRSNTPTGAIFNRKDLYTLHVRRLHMPHSVMNETLLGDDRKRWEGSTLRRFQQDALRQRYKLPETMTCPTTGCGWEYHGPDAWDQRMEHVARHLEAAGQGREEQVVFGGDRDKCLVEWASRKDVGIIKWVEGSWELTEQPLTVDLRLEEEEGGGRGRLTDLDEGEVSSDDEGRYFSE